MGDYQVELKRKKKETEKVGDVSIYWKYSIYTANA